MTQHPHPRPDLDRHLDDREADSLVLSEEHLRVRTERVPSGRVTFRKRVVTEERTLTVTVRREELEIIEESAADITGEATEPVLTGDRLADTRRDATAGADDDGLRRTPEGHIEIILRAEEPVVTMQTVPVERVVIRRGVVSDTETVTAEVAHEEAVLDRDDLEPRR